MELTRYWRAEQDGRRIEVQWTGFRFQGGWTLRLLVNGELKASQKVRRFVRDLVLGDGPVTVHFRGQGFRHRCTISVRGKVLTDRTQAWNALTFSVMFGVWGLALIFIILRVFFL